MQRPGFNIECKDSNNARWGYCFDCNSATCNGDDDDADATIGIGIIGQPSQTAVGAGWTDDFGPWGLRN